MTIPTDGLFAPDSVMWKISRERVILLGGPAAAILQISHPSVARGVADHSDFRNDTLGRLLRTVAAVYTVAFEKKDRVEALASQVARMHAKVRSQGNESRYSAFDADLQMWVLATLVATGTFSYEAIVGPLTESEKEDYLRSMRIWAQVFGLPPSHGPQTWPEFQAYYDAMINGPVLGSDPVCARMTAAIVRPARPLWLNQSGMLFEFLATELIPSPVRERIGLRSTLWSSAAWSVTRSALAVLHPLTPPSLAYCEPYRRRLSESAPTRP